MKVDLNIIGCSFIIFPLFFLFQIQNLLNWARINIPQYLHISSILMFLFDWLLNLEIFTFFKFNWIYFQKSSFTMKSISMLNIFRIYANVSYYCIHQKLWNYIYNTILFQKACCVSKACYFQHVSAKCMRKNIFMFSQGVGTFGISILKSWKSKKKLNNSKNILENYQKS